MAYVKVCDLRIDDFYTPESVIEIMERLKNENPGVDLQLDIYVEELPYGQGSTIKCVVFYYT